MAERRAMPRPWIREADEEVNRTALIRRKETANTLNPEQSRGLSPLGLVMGQFDSVLRTTSGGVA